MLRRNLYLLLFIVLGPSKGTFLLRALWPSRWSHSIPGGDSKNYDYQDEWVAEDELDKRVETTHRHHGARSTIQRRAQVSQEDLQRLAELKDRIDRIELSLIQRGSFPVYIPDNQRHLSISAIQLPEDGTILSYDQCSDTATSKEGDRVFIVRTGISPLYFGNPSGFEREIAFYSSTRSFLEALTGKMQIVDSFSRKMMLVEIPARSRSISKLSLKPANPGEDTVQIDYRQFARIIAQSIRIISRLHAYGIVHGSISSRSILVRHVEDVSEVRLVDFSRTRAYIGNEPVEDVSNIRFGAEFDQFRLDTMDEASLGQKDDMVKLANVFHSVLNTRFSGLFRRTVTADPILISHMSSFEAEMNSLDLKHVPQYQKWIDLFDSYEPSPIF